MDFVNNSINPASSTFHVVSTTTTTTTTTGNHITPRLTSVPVVEDCISTNKSTAGIQLEAVVRMNNLGVASIESSDCDQAIHFFRRALDKASETTYYKIGASSSNSVGSHGSSSNTSFPASATPFLASKVNMSPFAGLSSSSSIGGVGGGGSSSSSDKHGTTEVSRSLYVYQRGEYDEGMHTFSVPILLDVDAVTIPAAIATVLFNMGQSYLRTNENEAASAAFLKSYQIAQWNQMHAAASTGTTTTTTTANGPTPFTNSPLRSDSKDHNRSITFSTTMMTNNHNNSSYRLPESTHDGSNCSSPQDMISPGGCVSMMAILHNIGHVQYRTGQYEEAVRTYARALHLGKNAFHQSPHDMLQVAATLNCLGVLYFHLPKAETEKAMDLYMESLAIQRAVYGADAETKEIATTLNNIGRIHYMKGEHDEALELYQQAMKMRRRLLGDEHLDVAATIYNAGQTHHQRGDLVEAMSLYQEFLVIARKRLGTHHRDVAIMLKCMAQIHHERKEYTEAAALYQEALVTGKAALGNFHPEVASTLNKLGNLYYEKGDFDAAIRVYKEGLEVERAVLDVFHPNVVVTLTNIGQIHKLRGDYQAALRVYREAVAIQRHSLGPSHPNIAATLSSIALIHYQSRNFTKSLDVYQEALRIRRDAFGDDNLEVAANLNSIGLVLFKMELHDVAMQSFLESLRIRRRILGPDHRDVAIILYNIATIHLETGDDDEAMEFYRETLRVERISLGQNHRDLVLTIQHVGQVHQQRGELLDALKYFHEALIIQRQNCHMNGNTEQSKADFGAIAQTLNLIGNVHLQRGDAGETVKAFSEALRLFRRAGKSDDELAISGFNFYGLSKLHPECSSAA